MKYTVNLCLVLLIVIALGGPGDIVAKTSAERSSKLGMWAHTWEEASKKPISVRESSRFGLGFAYPTIRFLPISQIHVFQLKVNFNEGIKNKRENPKSYKGIAKCRSKQKSQEQRYRRGCQRLRP